MNSLIDTLASKLPGIAKTNNEPTVLIKTPEENGSGRYEFVGPFATAIYSEKELQTLGFGNDEFALERGSEVVVKAIAEQIRGGKMVGGQERPFDKFLNPPKHIGFNDPINLGTH